VLITEVLSNSPAAKAGMKTGDILVGIDGKTIGDSSAMLDTVSQPATRQSGPAQSDAQRDSHGFAGKDRQTPDTQRCGRVKQGRTDC